MGHCAPYVPTAIISGTVHPQHNTTHDTMSYHAMPHHTITHHITPYNIVPCHAIAYHITPDHLIIPYHIMPFHTTPTDLHTYPLPSRLPVSPDFCPCPCPLSKLTNQCLSCDGKAGAEQLALLIIVPLMMLIMGIVASVFRLRSVYNKMQSTGSGGGGNNGSVSEGARRGSAVGDVSEPPPAVHPPPLPPPLPPSLL